MKNPFYQPSVWQSFSLIVAGALFSAPLLSAEALDHLNVQEPERPAYLPGKPGESFQLPPIPPSADKPIASSGHSVNAARIAFRGNQVISSVDLESVAAPYAGKRLTEVEIETLRQTLTRYYIDRGYVNSGAVVGKNAWDGDTLTFDIVEGRLSEVRMNGLERLRDSYVISRLVKNDDRVLNLNDLRERFQLLLGDPLFDRMNARLMPGQDLGDAILDIDVTRARPYQFVAFANNYRPPSIGANSFGISGWIRNLTGYGDLVDVSLQDSFPDWDSPRVSLGWRMPINQSGTQLSLQVDRGRSSVVEAPLNLLDIKSKLETTDFGLSQRIAENLQHKLVVGINRVLRENRTTLLGEPFSFTPGEPDGVTKISAWRFWQEYSYRAEHQVLALRSTFIVARNNIQRISGLPAGAPVQPDSEYQLWLGQAQYAHQLLKNGGQLILRGSIQETRDPLLPLDRMSLGGIYTVRGFRENQMLSDRGSIFSIEFESPLMRKSGSEFNLSVVPFFDWGRGKNFGGAASTISSVGLATRLRWQGFSLDFAIAKRLQHPDAITTTGGTLQDRGIHVQLSYNVFN